MDQVRVGFIKNPWDPNDHILKVLGTYLYFLLSYSGSLIKLLTYRRREKREELVILVVASP